MLIYGALLAGASFALAWIDYARLARTHAVDVWLFVAAAAFLGLGVFVGAQVYGARGLPPPDGNPAALKALGVSERELEVLRALAAGRSNKEIAMDLGVSPNTVKSHVARLFDKLGARRRVELVNRARELSLLP